MIGEIVFGIIRHVLTIVGGSAVAQGYLDNDELTKGIGALITLIAIGWSVWSKAKKRTVPGGEFNPKAEVRKAEPVGIVSRGEAEPVHKPRFPRRGGFVGSELLSIMAALIMGVIGTACAIAQAFDVPHYLRTVDPATCGGRPLSEWIGTHLEDKRPFLVRLARSITANAKWKVKQDKETGAMSLGLASLEIKGGADF